MKPTLSDGFCRAVILSGVISLSDNVGWLAIRFYTPALKWTGQKKERIKPLILPLWRHQIVMYVLQRFHRSIGYVDIGFYFIKNRVYFFRLYAIFGGGFIAIARGQE